MSPPRPLFCRPAPARRQRGFVLVTGLLFLVVLTLLGVALFRGTGLMDRISANSRDKQRAFEAAQSALQYAEWWLASSAAASVQATPVCTGVVDGTTPANIKICLNPLVNPNATDWPVRFDYKPATLTVAQNGGLDSKNDVNYSLAPAFYIQSIGLDSTGSRNLYQVTAYGRGGDASTFVVVRSIFQMGASAGPDLGGLK